MKPKKLSLLPEARKHLLTSKENLIMIDLRSNILDGTDCGPQSFAESLEICRAAVAYGVHTLVATPRWKAGSFEPPLAFEEITRKVEQLQRVLRGSLSIKSGFVIEFSRSLLELVEHYGSRLALGAKQHLLISLPSTYLPAETDDVWAGLRGQGFYILIAHPECSPAIRRNPTILSRWASSGIKFQIDAASVAGLYGREVKKFALDCLRHCKGNMVVASNARDVQFNSLTKAREELIGHFGERQTKMLIREIPTSIIDGVEMHLTEKSEAAVSGLSSFFNSINLFKAHNKQPEAPIGRLVNSNGIAKS